jgi:hypothetical protein
MTISATSLTFAPVEYANGGPTQELMIVNPGSQNVNIAFTVPSSFNIYSRCGTMVPANGGTCPIEVNANPSTIGPLSGTLSITSASQTFSVALTGTGTGVTMPATYSFGNQNVGVPSAQAAIPITVTSGESFVGGISVTGPFKLVNNCSQWALYNAPGGTTCQQYVVFTPTASGPATGVLSVSFLGSGGPVQTMTLTGNGVLLASLTTNPTSFNFGETWMANNIQYTITNNSSVIQSFNVMSNNWVFDTVNNNCPGGQSPSATYSLPPGQSCNMYVAYYAQGTGSFQGDFVITSVTDGSVTTLPLQATWKAANTTPNQLVASTGTAAFANTAVGSTSATLPITITNTGSTPDGFNMGLSGLGQTAQFSVVNTNCNFNGTTTLPAGASCTVLVAFSPKQPGSWDQVLWFGSTTDGTGNQPISLIGTASPNANQAASYVIAVNPGTLNIQAGQTGTATFTLTPQANFKGTVTLTCDNLPATVSCVFNPATLTSDGSGKPLSSTLTVVTQNFSGASFGWLPALMVLALFAFRKRLKVGVLTVLLIAGITAGVTTMTGCGTGFMPGTTAAGLKSMNVTATATVNGVTTSQSASLMINVTQ